MTKPVLNLLATPFDAKALARLHTSITGKEPNAAEVAAVQKALDRPVIGLPGPPRQQKDLALVFERLKTGSQDKPPALPVVPD